MAPQRSECETRFPKGRLMLGSYARTSRRGGPRERKAHRTQTSRVAHSLAQLHDLATPRTPAFRMPDAAYRATRKLRRPAASLAHVPAKWIRFADKDMRQQ